MRLYNQNIDKIQEYKTISTIDGTFYVDKVTEEQLNSYGYFKVEFQSQPNRRYYTHTEQNGIVNGKYVVGYNVVERPIGELQDVMLRDLKEAHDKYSIRPRVDTGLGYFVDGSRIDKENFEVGKELNLPKVKDADNNWHDVTSSDYDTILLAIKQNGVNLWYTKNTKEEEIKALPTVADCILYEATPYNAMVDIIDEATGLPTGQQELKTFYKNNVKEW